MYGCAWIELVDWRAKPSSKSTRIILVLDPPRVPREVLDEVSPLRQLHYNAPNHISSVSAYMVCQLQIGEMFACGDTRMHHVRRCNVTVASN